MNLLLVGASYRTADVGLLERLATAPDDVAARLTELVRLEHVAEALLLSTCNRVEVYAAVSGFHGGVTDVSGWLAAQAGVEPAALAPHLYVRWDTEAVEHALRVAAGLDSMVAGETQILGQVREAYAAAMSAGTAGRLLHDLLQQALRVGKRVHAETGIDTAGRSVVTAALALAARRLASDSDGAADELAALAGRRVLVIGAGAMGALTLATLSRAGAGPGWVASRTPERAQRLADTYGATPIPLTEVAAVLPAADLVVTATASRRPVLTAATVAEALAHRSDRPPLVVCDLAVPRDVEPEVADLPGVVLIDLARLAADLPKETTAQIEAAERIVAAETSTVASGLRNARVAPTVAALRARADEVMTAELTRLSQRLPELTEEQRAEISHTIHRLVRRLLHEPTVRVRQLAAEPGGEAYAQMLADLFDLRIPHARQVDGLPELAGEEEPA